MKFPTELINKLIPEELPPDRYFVGQAIQLAESVKNPMFRRSYLWVNALTIAGMESNIQIPSRLSGVSAGFVFINKKVSSVLDRMKIIDGFSFGVNLLISSEETRPQEVLPLLVGERVFPIVVNFGHFEPHGLPTHPSNGTGTCWVENKQSGSWEKGILTCRHTLASMPLGSKLTLYPSYYHSNPTQGYLADMDICTIDAAIVKIDKNDWPSSLSQLPICHAVAPGQSVSFEGRNSNGQGTVLRTFQHSGYVGNLFGQRVFTDCVGINGDSGSLFVDQNNGQGIGIYMGTVPDGAGSTEGLCQHLSQAASYFEFSTFS
jgi:hypothetical protein